MTGPTKISYERAVLRMESAAWRTSPRHARSARKQLDDELTGDMHRVRIVTTKSKRVLMGGSSGRLPVLVENTLPGQSVKVRLVATSENSAKLRLGQLAPEDAVIELRPGSAPSAGSPRRRPATATSTSSWNADPRLGRPDVRGRRVDHRDRHRLRASRAAHHRRRTCRTLRGRRSAGHQSEAPPGFEAAGDGTAGMGAAGPGGQGNGHPGPGFPGRGYPPPNSRGIRGRATRRARDTHREPRPRARLRRGRRGRRPRGRRRRRIRRDTRVRRRRAYRVARRTSPPRRRLTFPSPAGPRPSPRRSSTRPSPVR